MTDEEIVQAKLTEDFGRLAAHFAKMKDVEQTEKYFSLALLRMKNFVPEPSPLREAVLNAIETGQFKIAFTKPTSSGGKAYRQRMEAYSKAKND